MNSSREYVWCTKYVERSQKQEEATPQRLGQWFSPGSSQFCSVTKRKEARSCYSVGRAPHIMLSSHLRSCGNVTSHNPTAGWAVQLLNHPGNWSQKKKRHTWPLPTQLTKGPGTWVKCMTTEETTNQRYIRKGWQWRVIRFDGKESFNAHFKLTAYI